MGLWETVQLYREEKQQEELKALQEQALRDQELFASTKDVFEEALKKELGELYDVLVAENHGHFSVDSRNRVNFEFTYFKHEVVITLDAEWNSTRFLIQGCGSVQTIQLHYDLLKFLANLEDCLQEFRIGVTVIKTIKAVTKDNAFGFLAQELEQHGFEVEID
jgi:hypothetical protein